MWRPQLTTPTDDDQTGKVSSLRTLRSCEKDTCLSYMKTVDIGRGGGDTAGSAGRGRGQPIYSYLRTPADQKGLDLRTTLRLLSCSLSLVGRQSSVFDFVYVFVCIL